MRAVVLLGHGGFDQLSVRDDVPVPTPGADEVLVNVRASAVNNTDINTRLGWYAKDAATEPDLGWSGEPFHFPRIQGADACGSIVAVGPGVDTFRIGQRVLVEPVFRPLGSPLTDARYFGSEVDGGFAEYAVVPSRHAHTVMSDLSDEELASFPCSYSAAENMLVRVDPQAGERVLVTGASGGVGSAAVQLATARGAFVTGVASTNKHPELGQVGAHQTVDRHADLLAEFGPNSFDVVVDVVGGPHWPHLLELLRPGGRYATCGAIAGPIVPLDLRTLYLKDLRLVGCTVLDEGVFAGLIARIEQGQVKPLVAAAFALSDIVAAQELFLTKQHIGKIVLTTDVTVG
jgi:NADPH:quinone reductase-like Zn-dependent oxidoreductase